MAEWTRWAEDVLDALQSTNMDAVELREVLVGFVRELKQTPEDAVKVFENEIESLTERLIDRGECPICGCRLEFNHDSDCDTYVPYGSTRVLESEGGTLECPNCGYEVEE